MPSTLVSAAYPSSSSGGLSKAKKQIYQTQKQCKKEKGRELKINYEKQKKKMNRRTTMKQKKKVGNETENQRRKPRDHELLRVLPPRSLLPPAARPSSAALAQQKEA